MYLILGIIIGILLTSCLFLFSLILTKIYLPEITKFIDKPFQGKAYIVGDDDETAEVRDVYNEADKNNQAIIIE